MERRQLEFACDHCGGKQPDPDETLCKRCKLNVQAQSALDKGWLNQYHMIQGMIRDLDA